MLTGNPLCLLLRKIEATSATLITRGKEITFKEEEKLDSYKTHVSQAPSSFWLMIEHSSTVDNGDK